MSHQAALIPSKGQPLVVETVKTVPPGPGEVLISVSAIALNPIDYYMRDAGFFVASYPAIVGSDIAGTVEAVGSDIPSSSPFKKGARVLAFGNTFYKQGQPDANNYGAFQQKVVVPIESVAVIPDSLGFVDAATLPMSVGTALTGWMNIGLPVSTRVDSKQAVLVWGAGSSIGAGAIQTAKAMGFTVYGTASPKNFENLKALGANKLFDYKDPEVVSNVIEAAKADAVSLKHVYRAAGDIGGSDLPPVQEILKASGGGAIASAVILPEYTPQVEGVETKFVQGSADPEERKKFLARAFHDFLAPRLAKGEYIPAPKAKVVGSGLESLNKGLDELRGGVSNVKIVIEL
ncbi:zinc-binding oxidoreductase-like protein CipB [Exophiala viscosa]|uniref:Zinc-binding oxidoreductase-like protein CipB n=1 Tax=Exophiala viscosa TaxID=2486360 RepID=A0AAN6DW59_9EURO|nr:zinc-binding oxidoreductase-like protein CipB [Exophiala viscosa]KAI1625647.1 zinc-binding oxidoreductase-like protein CipB [Exophiala viscosa]